MRTSGVEEMFKRILGDPRIKTVYELSRIVMGKDPVHGWPHVERVLGLALKLAEKYYDRIDLEALVVAVLLHDIGRRFEEDYGQHHAVISASLARRILVAMSYSEEFVEKVEQIILSHSFSLKNKAETLEAKILSDADKLDAIGAIGVVRAFMLGGERRESIEEKLNHFHEKLLKLKNLLYLEESKRMAERRHRFMELFLRELERDLLESEITLS